jgi:hypothetical protein
MVKESLSLSFELQSLSLLEEVECARRRRGEVKEVEIAVETSKRAAPSNSDSRPSRGQRLQTQEVLSKPKLKAQIIYLIFIKVGIAVVAGTVNERELRPS